MNDRPKLTIKKPLSLEKRSQLSQGLQYLIPNTPKKLSSKEQDRLMHEAQKKKKEEIKTALKWLHEQFPLTFNLKDIKPLKLHIDKDIYPYLEKESGPSRIKIRLALQYYTHNLNYLKALISGTHRYNLEGQEVEEITQEQKTYAQERLEKTTRLIKSKKNPQNKSFS